MSKDLPLSPEDVAEITTILDKSNYETLDIETARFRLRVSKSGEGWTQDWSAMATLQTATPVAVDEVEEVVEAGITFIRAPLPGTFYRAPQPGAAPFVEVGSKVQPDTVVGIMETMKLMNSIHAGTSGEIVSIVAENGEALDENALLMKVKTA